MMRLGLCCQFVDEPIRFRTTTAKHVAGLPRPEALAKLAALCRQNAESLQAAVDYCAAHRIGGFRVFSGVLPLKTHPQAGYELRDLPDGDGIRRQFEACGESAAQRGIRLTFHPDQFVVLNSPRQDVVDSSIRELDYQAEVAEWIGADVINIHAGGAYGEKRKALERFVENLHLLPSRVRSRLTLENDDTTFSSADLLPVCRSQRIPLVYDVHHHRCCPDDVDPLETTCQALETWDREPLFHVSSPRDGWRSPDPRRHADYIDLRDFPRWWDDLDLTVEVEAKAKERAVLRVRKGLQARRAKRERARLSAASENDYGRTPP